jgi:hypothetical protein
MFRPIAIGIWFLLLIVLLSSCRTGPQLPAGAVILLDNRSAPSGMREVYLEMSEENFTRANIEQVVDYFRPQCQPQGLSVNVFSSRDLLLERIRQSKIPDTAEFENTEYGRKLAKLHYQQTYFPTGTFVAVYSRFLDDEYLEYRLSKDNIPTTVVKFDQATNPFQCSKEGNR